jgi:hypothetical protein
MATQSVSGKAPLTFTDSFGAQRSVPLSAFVLNGSTIELDSKWTSQFSGADTQILLALANADAAAGRLTPPPVAPPAPAITFTAVTAGPEGNGVTVTVTPDAGPLMTTKLLINATETDTYSGLADATAAANQIGVDAPTGKKGDPPGGTGVVTVQQGSATGTGLPKDAQTLTVKSATAVLATDGSTTLFKLVPRAGYAGSGIPVKVNLDPGGTTFTLTATYDAGNSTKVTATGLGSLPAPVAFLVSASAPPSGLALPAAGDVTLSGGSSGIPATGTIYTS